MNLNRILRHVRKSWRTLAICAAAGLLLAGLITLVQAPRYEAKAVALISPNALGTVGPALGADAYLIQQRAQAYVEVAESSRVLEAAGHTAGVDDLDESSVSVEWATTSPANVEITATQPTAQRAADVANAIAERLAVVVEAIERPPGGGNAVVRVSVARGAQEPSSPVSPDPILNLLLGLVAGLAVGFPLVLARLLFNRGISDAAALSEATGEAPLAVIAAGGSGTALILRDAPQSTPAETFRKLRTSIQFAKPDAAARSIVVTAPQSGAGATTVAANLALATAEAGRRVVLVDGNLRDPALSGLLRLDNGPGLAEVLSGAAELEAALRPGGVPDLTVLGAGAGGAGSLVAGPGMVTLLERLETLADLVIIDAPPVLPYADAGELAAIADAALLVARYGRTNVDDLLQARLTLTQVGTTVLGVIINAVPSSDRAAVVSAGQPPARSKSAAAEPELAERSRA